MMQEKIERNLRIFEENKEDVALLWRLHPLMEATIASILPQLKERYDGITQKTGKPVMIQSVDV